MVSLSPAAADLHFPTTGDLAEPYSAAMDTTDPALVTVAVGLAKSSGVGKTMDVRSGQVATSAEPSAMGAARKRLGTVLVQGGVPAHGAAAVASKGNGRGAAVASEPQAKERVAVGKRKRPSATKRPAVSPPIAAAATHAPAPAPAPAPMVFDEMTPRCVLPPLPPSSRRFSQFLPVEWTDELDARVCSSGQHDARGEFASLLDENAVNIDTAPLGSYGYDDMDGGDHGRGEDEEEEEEVEEIGGEVFEASQASKCSKRSKGYTQLEDEVLVRAWESVSLDAIHGADQTGKRYWQRIEDKFFRLMPKNIEKTPRSYRSLQGRWDVIKVATSRWSGCLEQVYNAPPSGTNEADWVSAFPISCCCKWKWFTFVFLL